MALDRHSGGALRLKFQSSIFPGVRTLVSQLFPMFFKLRLAGKRATHCVLFFMYYERWNAHSLCRTRSRNFAFPTRCDPTHIHSVAQICYAGNRILHETPSWDVCFTLRRPERATAPSCCVYPQQYIHRPEVKGCHTISGYIYYIYIYIYISNIFHRLTNFVCGFARSLS